ncbi:MAG: hypothetical protein JXB49_21605 [Bacteroidales bacterium]|nr:hypothetical protein [Bacteroidales bacterium]
MREYIENENKASQRLVCCSDILGFSRKFKTMSTEQKEQEYSKIIETLKSACHYDSELELKRCNYCWFSDTFILYSYEFSFENDDKFIEDTLIRFFTSVKALFFRFLYWGFPLRGGIGYGEFIGKPTENIYIGEALIDTYKKTEKHAWAGITLLPDLSSRINKCEKVGKLLTTYKVPINYKSPQEMTVINWASDRSIVSKSNPEEYIKTQFRKYSDPMSTRAESYCANTISFLKEKMG